MKVLVFILELLTSPFALIFKTNIKADNNKVVKSWAVFLIALVLVIALVFIYYWSVIFK